MQVVANISCPQKLLLSGHAKVNSVDQLFGSTEDKHLFGRCFVMIRLVQWSKAIQNYFQEPIISIVNKHFFKR